MRISAGLICDVGDRIRLGHHGDRARGRVDAALRLGLGHALHAVAARLELELRVHAVADDAHDHFLVAAELGGDADTISTFHRCAPHSARTCGTGRPRTAPTRRRRCPARIFEEHVALVVGVLRQQRRLQLDLERRDPRLRRRALLLRELAHSRDRRAISSAAARSAFRLDVTREHRATTGPSSACSFDSAR